MLLVKRLLWVRFLTNYVPVQLKIQACTSRDCHPQQVILNARFCIGNSSALRRFFLLYFRTQAIAPSGSAPESSSKRNVAASKVCMIRCCGYSA